MIFFFAVIMVHKNIVILKLCIKANKKAKNAVRHKIKGGKNEQINEQSKKE